MSHARIHASGVAALVLGLSLASLPGIALAQDASPPPPLPTVPPETEQLSGNWPVPQGDLSATRNAVDSSISKDTVGDLQLAWTFDITAPGIFGGITSQPIVVGDTVYIQDMRSNVFALDRDTGAQKWEAPFDVGSIGPNGVAVAYDMVYAGLSDTGEVVALNASDGSVVWRQKIGSPPGEGIDMSPIVYDGTVYISTTPGTGLGSFYAGGDRGVLYALDARTGETKWWFDTTKGGFDAVAVAGGGGLWYPPSIDQDGNIYFGVGNPAPWPLTPECPNGACRPGKNLYTSSMVSIDPSTGAVRWYYQDRPHDLLDLDFQATPILDQRQHRRHRHAPRHRFGQDRQRRGGSPGHRRGGLEDAGRQAPERRGEGPARRRLDPRGVPGHASAASRRLWPTPTARSTPPILTIPQYQTATGQDDAKTCGFDAGTGGLVALDVKTGKVRWDIKLPTLPVGGSHRGQRPRVRGRHRRHVRGVRPGTGDQVWSYDGDLGFNAAPAIAGDYVFVGGGYPKVAHTDPDASPAPTADPSASKAPGPVPKLFAFRIGGPKPQPSGAPTTEPSATPSQAPASPSPSAAPASEAPATRAPATTAPGTEAPATEAPTTAPATEAPGSPVASAAATVQLSAVDLAFQPKDFTIPANTDVTIDVSNDGAVVHDFFQPDTKADTGQIQPGQSGTVVLNLPPGTYQYWCSIPGHRDAGMSGTITVQ